VFRVPVTKMNQVMRRDGRSTVRWLVDLSAIDGCAVRDNRP